MIVLQLVSISLVHLPFSSGGGGVGVAPITTSILSTPVFRLCSHIPILIGSGAVCEWCRGSSGR